MTKRLWVMLGTLIFGCLTFEGTAWSDPYSAYRYSTSSRVIGIGDLHGDLTATRNTLRLARAIDLQDNWIGGDLTVVQVGDQLDRGDEDRDVIDLFEKLSVEARIYGGRVISLNGNHEFMNVNHEFTHVSDKAFLKWLDVPYATPAREMPPRISDEPGAFERFQAFTPGGVYAKILAERPIFTIINDTVFVHGGIRPKHLTQDLVKMDLEGRTWMKGEKMKGEKMRGEKVGGGETGEDLPLLLVNREGTDAGPIWMREYAADHVLSADCDELQEVLHTLGVQRMVVGHTPQYDIGINSACQERVWRIDSALSNFYEKQGRPTDYPVQIVEIQGNSVKILRASASLDVGM